MIYQQTIDKNLMFLKENAKKKISSLTPLARNHDLYKHFQASIVSWIMIKAMIIGSVIKKKDM